MRRGLRAINLAIVATMIPTIVTSCSDDGGKATSPHQIPSASSLGAASFAASAGLTSDVGAMANTYPDSQVVNTAAAALAIVQNGTGRAAYFQAGSHHAGHFETGQGGTTLATLFARSAGTQHTVFAEKLANGGSAVRADHYGNGSAGNFRNLGSGIGVAALATGAGLTLLADKVGSSGGAASFSIQSTSNASGVLTATTNGRGRAGFFQVNNATSTGEALRATSNGPGNTFFVQRTGSGGNTAATIQSTSFNTTGAALRVNNAGSGFALDVNAAGVGGGVRVTTAGGPGLQVVGGVKNAVVRTSSGARALYAEESSEVWFSDYGFGQLTNGRARITLDRTFAETVSLTNSYHVFVQSYGDAELVVRGRSSTGFEVVRRHGAEDAQFSYRIVAKRRGFDQLRLARAPWADTVVRLVR